MMAPRLDNQHQRGNMPRAIVQFWNRDGFDVHHERRGTGRVPTHDLRGLAPCRRRDLMDRHRGGDRLSSTPYLARSSRKSPSRSATIGLRSPRMQDCYTFDVGDFGKLGLLRHIHRLTNLRLGVLCGEPHLGRPAATASTSPTWTTLRSERAIPDPVGGDAAGVSIPARGPLQALRPLLPAGTLFHDTPVPARDRRSRWLHAAVSSVQGSAVEFCDPDNGLTFNEPVAHSGTLAWTRSGRCIAVDNRLSMYHTPDRSAPHAKQLTSVLERLRQAIPDLGSSWAARFRRGSSRVFVDAGTAGARSRHRWRNGSDAVDGVGAPLSLRGRIWRRDGSKPTVNTAR